MKLENVKGLDPKFRHDVCGVGNKNQPRCMFLRYARYQWGLYLVCSKGTEIGNNHYARMQKLMQENPDGLLRQQADDEELKLEIITADNCPGRGEEFTYLFEEQKNKKQ